MQKGSILPKMGMEQPESASPMLRSRRASVFQVKGRQKTICGDIFGSSPVSDKTQLSGMLFESRVLAIDSSKRMKKKVEAFEEEERKTEEVEDLGLHKIDVDDKDDTEGEELTAKWNPKQQLALTIRNWTLTPENDEHLIAEGAVQALVTLSSLDDQKIKKCCAGAFYYLSTRAVNRAEVLNLNGAAGVAQVTLSVKQWIVAKYCALSLSNFSMEPKFESIMASQGSVTAIVVLLGIRNQALAAPCVQALYNLTCVDEDYKNMERITKLILTMPPNSFDFTTIMMKTMVNCARFEKLRPRILEDGCINVFFSTMNTLNVKENKAVT